MEPGAGGQSKARTDPVGRLSFPAKSMRYQLVVFVWMGLAVAASILGQPAIPPRDEMQKVNGSVQPAPLPRPLKIEVSDQSGIQRGSGEIQEDGTFHVQVKGSLNETLNVTVRDGSRAIYTGEETLGTPWEMQIGAFSAPSGDSSLVRTIMWSLVFSMIAGLVELQFRSKAELASCLGKSSILYVALLCFFNTLAAATAEGLLKDKIPGGPFFTPMFYALFGVFAFETVLSNTNITVFEKGVLAFQEWTGKARDPAVSAVQKRQIQKESDRTDNLAKKLMGIPDATLNTYVLDAFGEPAKKLIEDIKESAARYGVDPKFYLALGFARSFPDRAAAAVKGKSA